MRYLLDTCAVSEMMKPAPDRRFQKWWDANYVQSGISSLTVGELWRGVRKLPKGKRKDELKEWLYDIEFVFELAMPDPSVTVMKNWAVYVLDLESKGLDYRKLPVIDSILAATALTFSLTLVTRNESDFPDVPILNPWT